MLHECNKLRVSRKDGPCSNPLTNTAELVLTMMRWLGLYSVRRTPQVGSTSRPATHLRVA